MAVSATGETRVGNGNKRGKIAPLTVFSEVQVGRSPQPTSREERHPLEKPSEASRYETTTDCSRSWLVRATENITITPRCRQVATGMMDAEKGENLQSLVCRTRPCTDTGGTVRPCNHTSRNGHTAAFSCDVTVRWRKKESSVLSRPRVSGKL